MQKDKIQLLKDEGVFNRRAKKLKEPLFQSNGFFDPHDLIQVKYEMVRQVTHEGKSISDSAEAFGMSRPTFYQAKEALEREGFLGLVPKKSGPKRRHKLSDEIMIFVRHEVASDQSISLTRLTELVKKKFSITIHPRSIERALVVQKKMSASQ